jgi:hypothetical protein
MAIGRSMGLGTRVAPGNISRTVRHRGEANKFCEVIRVARIHVIKRELRIEKPREAVHISRAAPSIVPEFA